MKDEANLDSEKTDHTEAYIGGPKYKERKLKEKNKPKHPSLPNTGVKRDDLREYVLKNNWKKRKFKTWQELAHRVEEYFEWIQGETQIVDQPYQTNSGKTIIKKEKVVLREPEKPTMTGLTLFLGFASLTSVYAYRDTPGEFGQVMKRAILMVEYGYEKLLSEGKNPTGAIFALKNMSSGNWNDRKVIDNSADANKTDWDKISLEDKKKIHKMIQGDEADPE